MIKYLSTVLLSVGSLASYQAVAQTTGNEPHVLTEYFDAKGNKMPSAEGANRRVVSTYQDSIRGTVQSYYASGQLQSRTQYENIRRHLADGPDEAWYENGQLRRHARMSHGTWDGELLTYYPNGTLKRREGYNSGESTGGTCYAADGREVAFYPFEKMPVPPLGGFTNMLRYIGQHVGYPAEALKKNIQGKVFVNFIVDTTGVVRDVQVKQGVHPSIDEAARKVIASLPAWEPGYQDGNPVMVSFTVPVTFNIKGKKPRKTDKPVGSL